MPNPFFRFKQFTVHQQHAAMKVCTDACLFGAWIAENLQRQSLQSALDIGTGTGLFPLLIRQKNNITFDCVEIDEAASHEAENNFAQSPWPQSFTVFNTAIQQYTSTKKYDVIISNPPFYNNDLKSPDDKRNDALHNTSLQLEELFYYADKLLNVNGSFIIMLPYHRLHHALQLADSYKLYLHQQSDIKQTVQHPFFRTFLWFNTTKSATASSCISIKDAHNNYTPQFTTLLKDYYLYL